MCGAASLFLVAKNLGEEHPLSAAVEPQEHHPDHPCWKEAEFLASVHRMMGCQAFQPKEAPHLEWVQQVC